jgi:hypothetical protein
MASQPSSSTPSATIPARVEPRVRPAAAVPAREVQREVQGVLAASLGGRDRVGADPGCDVGEPPRREQVMMVTLGRGADVGTLVAQLAPALQRPVADALGDLVEGGQLAGLARAVRVWRPAQGEAAPAAVLAVVEDDLVAALEGVLERCERVIARAAQLFVGGAHDAEGVVIEAEPQMQPVLLDAAAGCETAPACALPAQPPSKLIDGNVEALTQRLTRRELERRRYSCRPAAEHGDLCSRHANPLVGGPNPGLP